MLAVSGTVHSKAMLLHLVFDGSDSHLNISCSHLLSCQSQDGSYDLSAPPPFGLSDIREAIPKQCWEKNTARSLGHLALDVALVTGLAAGAYALNAWWAWPLYWVAQGTMFWALFVVGHDW